MPQPRRLSFSHPPLKRGIAGNGWAGALGTQFSTFAFPWSRCSLYWLQVIDSAQDLSRYLSTLKSATWVAVDTEADSLHAYPEKVCLIQISIAESDRLIDPLAGLDIGPLLDALSGHELIMHGADYDLRLLRKHHCFTPGSIFDTMLAARLLGVARFGLGDLVEQFLSVKLEKGPQKANWATRPLTARMEAYARNDTRYLKPLSDHLRAELKALGRLDWHKESCDRLIVECSRDVPYDKDGVWRVKGSHRLGRPELAVLREVWAWREKEAVRANRPPFFILSHEHLVRIAELAVEQRPFEGLLPKSMSERRKDALIKAVEKGRAVAPEHHPRIPRNSSRRASESERKRYIELQRRRDAHATQLKIDATLIATRSNLSDLAHDWEKHAPELMKWQLQLLTHP
jgi:ribonuclease D